MTQAVLPSVPQQTLDLFEAQRLAIVQAVVARCMAQPEQVTHHGGDAERLLTLGLDFTTQALGVAMRLQNGELLEQQLRWGNDRLPHDGVSAGQLLTRFELLASVISELLPPADAQLVNPYVQIMIDAQWAYITTPSQ